LSQKSCLINSSQGKPFPEPKKHRTYTQRAHESVSTLSFS
jgi:hypothetical protein